MKSTTNSSWILYSTRQATGVTGTADPPTSQPIQLNETVCVAIWDAMAPKRWGLHEDGRQSNQGRQTAADAVFQCVESYHVDRNRSTFTTKASSTQIMQNLPS